jgi:hypothetical protein
MSALRQPPYISYLLAVHNYSAMSYCPPTSLFELIHPTILLVVLSSILDYTRQPEAQYFSYIFKILPLTIFSVK